jgi:hypothetical protein
MHLALESYGELLLNKKQLINFQAPSQVNSVMTFKINNKFIIE